LLYGVVMAVIGMCARVLLPDLEDPNTAFTAIINLTLPDGIRGLVIAASIASMMSTASATMLAASTTFTEDLLPRLRGGKASGLGVNRLCTALVGAVMLGLSLLENDLIDALLIAYNLLVGGMLVPLVGAVYWARATTAGAIASMGLGCVAVIILMIRDGAGANTPLYYGLAVSLAAFVIVSLLTRPRDDTPAGGVLHTEPAPQAGAMH
jgi:SSS family solute:Na+ symporter